MLDVTTFSSIYFPPSHVGDISLARLSGFGLSFLLLLLISISLSRSCLHFSQRNLFPLRSALSRWHGGPPPGSWCMATTDWQNTAQFNSQINDVSTSCPLFMFGPGWIRFYGCYREHVFAGFMTPS